MASRYANLIPTDYADLEGWAKDDHAAAFAVFLRSARHMATQPPVDRPLGVSGADLQRIARLALALPENISRHAAKRVFEQNFRPWIVQPHDGSPFLTGYFEPEVEGSLTPTDRYRYPLYGRPSDLVDIDDTNRPADWDAACQFARRTDSGLSLYFDRAAIEDGALLGRGLEIVYLADSIDVFFIHVQGSASIRLGDGGRMRVSYAAKAGHPYTSIGKRLIERGVASPETMTLDRLRGWLAENRAEGTALMRENRSYVFFRELPTAELDPDLGAIAAAGVQITPGRSLAVDCRLHTYGTPIWLGADLPVGPEGTMERTNRLMIAQDTGSAIVGAARGDMFTGLGTSAGEIAGRIRHVPATFVMLKPI
jgi:membrane-bound lytic murein transglycosylase A